MRRLAAAGVIAAGAVAASGQGREGEGRAPPPPPQVLLGARAEALRTNLRVHPTVVIVGSETDYARLIGAWSLSVRFPILIDDGSDRAREDIARFVRAFGPERVVRWAAEAGAPPLPEDIGERQRTLESVVFASWGATDGGSLEGVWAQTHFSPFGVVVASARDHAWTAGVALAAGRGQPIIWTNTTPRPVGGVMSADALAALTMTIETGLESLERPDGWRGLGDGVEAVTLCLNQPSRLRIDGSEVALTDRIGRHGDGARWGWCGMVFGDGPRAAYRAMCALFLTPSSALLFDGYRPGFAPPFELQPAAEILQKAGWKVEMNAPPHGGVEQWRQRTRFALSTDFVHVNSSGMAPWFDLTPGRARASDVPALARPAAVHFIHSFSAQYADDVNTVAGRWLENGAYAYLGSMAEPMLGAFVPARALVTRLLLRAPLGVAVRQDDAALWRLNYFGDPLIVFGPAAPRLEGELDLPGAAPLDEAMGAALREKRLGAAAAGLVMLGRDADAARLARAALDEGALDAETARVVLPAAHRQRDSALFVSLFAAMEKPDRLRAEHADLLWAVARAEIQSTNDQRLLMHLRETVRAATAEEDAALLAPSLARVFGVGAARSLIAELTESATDERVRQRLVELGRNY